jgi:hypothetical protein
MKGERSRPLSPVNPQKLFGGEHKQRPDPTSPLVNLG